LYRETDDSQTEIGDGLLMRFHSNRRQDYGLAIYNLAELFPRFMEVAPVQATGAVLAAVESEVSKHARVPVESIIGETFQFGGEEAKFAEDLSHVWDASRLRQDAHLRLLDAFEEGLDRLAVQSGDPALLDQVVDRLVRDNRFAALWRKVLSAAVREPNTLGRRVWPLVAALPVLTSSDTLELAGRYLQVVFPLLGQAERETIERAILSIRAPDPERAGWATLRQDRLLGCVPEGYVTTTEANTRIRELRTQGGPPPNSPLFQMGEMESEEYTEAQWLEEQGVDMGAEPNRRLHELCDPVTKFAHQFANQHPTREQAEAVLPAIRDLLGVLTGGGDGADARVNESGWTHLTAACAVLAGAEWLESDPTTSGFIRAILLEGARHELPRPAPERDEHYEQHGAVVPSPRWHAAGGLLGLARFRTLADAEVVGAIRQLSQDLCAEVRAEVARHLSALYQTASETFWDLLRRVEGAESSRRIIHYALSVVGHLARRHPEEMLRIAHAVYYRFRDDPDASEIRRACLSIVLIGAERSADPYGGELVNAVICDMARLTGEAVYLVQVAAERLTIGPVEPPDPHADRLRLASFSFLQGVARAVREWLGVLEAQLQGVKASDFPEDARLQVKAVHEVADELGVRVYFASGSFDERMADQQPQRKKLTEAVKGRFLREALPLVYALSELAFPQVIHNILQALEAYIIINPRNVFLAVGRAVRQGQASGYQYDSLAAGLVVNIVRRYLADYRYLFREEPECRDALTEILNTFVRAGWPEAMGLTFRLEEIYR
jgi:hypothetical protein